MTNMSNVNSAKMFIKIISVMYLYIFGKILINGGVIQDSSNNIDRNGDFKVDLDITEDDYEMIDGHEIDVNLKINDGEEKFKALNKIASEEYEKTINHYCDDTSFKVKGTESNFETLKTETGNIATLASWVTVHSDRKINTDPKGFRLEVINDHIDSRHDATPENVYKAVNSAEFKSGLLESISEMLSLNINISNCTEEDKKGIGVRTITCWISDFKSKRHTYKSLAIRLWNIACIWMIVFLVFAVPMWCTKGWWSCCLCCKFFKPQDTIQEAKKYMMLNPPGILVTKRGGIIHYEPTERENDCYEEFVHFIRTL